MRHTFRLALIIPLFAAVFPAAAQQGTAPAALTKLQREVSADPASVAANRALGIWYYRNQRFSEARAPLEQARRLDPKDGTSALYAGLAAEQEKDWIAAKTAYTSYLAVGKTKRVRSEISARLIAVSNEEVKAAAKRAVANEATLAQQPGSPTTIAVLPFRCSGCDADIAPLERGMAELLITDLGKKKTLTLLERDRMQAIADEISLGQSARVDQATAVRAGKLIQAGRIVQGGIVVSGNKDLALSASVVDVKTSVIEGQGAKASGLLDQLFNVEKQLAFSVFDALGVQLTPAERQDVDRRPTNSLQAFLAYSRGLAAQDGGRLDEAARFFESAHTIDPGFGAAQTHAQQAQSGATAAPPAKVESNLGGTTEGQVATAASQGNSTGTTGGNLGSTLNNVVGSVNPTTTNSVSSNTSSSSAPPPTTRDAASEKTGTDQPAPTVGQVRIVITKP
jgi:tetratricopeptide (TPR) repeat protein